MVKVKCKMIGTQEIKYYKVNGGKGEGYFVEDKHGNQINIFVYEGKLTNVTLYGKIEKLVYSKESKVEIGRF